MSGEKETSPVFRALRLYDEETKTAADREAKLSILKWIHEVTTEGSRREVLDAYRAGFREGYRLGFEDGHDTALEVALDDEPEA